MLLLLTVKQHFVGDDGFDPLSVYTELDLNVNNYFLVFFIIIDSIDVQFVMHLYCYFYDNQFFFG